MTSPHTTIIGEIIRLIDSVPHGHEGIPNAYLQAVELLAALGIQVRVNPTTTPSADALRTALDHALLRYVFDAPASTEISPDRDT